MTLNVAIIGLGKMGSLHLRALTRLKTEGLIGKIYGVDSDVDKGRIYLNILDKFFNNINNIKHQHVDLVIIATPTYTHYDFIEKFLPITHVLVEKPLAESYDKFQEIKHLVKKVKNRLFIGHIERFNPVTDYLKRIISSNVQYLSFIRTSSKPLKPENYVNVVLDLMIHDVDLLSYIFSLKDINKVNILKVLSFLEDKFITTSHATLKIDNTLITLYSSWNYQRKYRLLKILTDHGIYSVDFHNRKVETPYSTLFWKGIDQVYEEDKHVVLSIINNEDSIIEFNNCLFSYELIFKILSSTLIIEKS